MKKYNKPVVKCSVAKCRFNEDSTCKKRKLVIEGLFSRSRLGTFCESFVALNQIVPVGHDKLEECQIVKCNANYCKHNEKGVCSKEVLQIESELSRYRSTTECNSFECK